jgi:hypothetical protein
MYVCALERAVSFQWVGRWRWRGRALAERID